ncbi:MAG: hypothetical protein ABI761_06265 [Saprospiraceae bacterium]
MKSKPWIDELYQDQLVTREIPLDLNHWAKAEALILAQEKAEKRRRMIMWILLLGIITTLGVLGWNQFVPVKDTEIKPTNPEIQEVKPQPANPEVAQHTESKNGDIKQAEKNQSSITSKNTDISSIGFTSIPNKKVRVSNGNMNGHSSQYKNISKNGMITSVNKDLNENTITGTINSNSALGTASGIEIKHELIDIDALNMKWNILNNNLDEELKIPATEIADEPIRIKKPTWKENGVRMTLAQESGLQVSNPSVQHAGFEWFHQKSIQSGLFYGYSLGYKSNFNHSQYAEVITSFQFEGFSSKLQNFGIKPEWMNALYAQANIGFDVKKNKLFIGIRPEFIIGTQGKVDRLSFKETTGIKDINQASISAVNKGWLQSGSLNELSWTLSIGYEYRIMKKLGIGIQIDHSLRSIYRPLDPQIKQQAIAAWNTGFRFSYILN